MPLMLTPVSILLAAQTAANISLQTGQTWEREGAIGRKASFVAQVSMKETKLYAFDDTASGYGLRCAAAA